MKIFTYKTFPAINMEHVQQLETLSNYENTKHFVRFIVSNGSLTDWPVDSIELANNIYNSIIDHLDDSTNHVHII